MLFGIQSFAHILIYCIARLGKLAHSLWDYGPAGWPLGSTCKTYVWSEEGGARTKEGGPAQQKVPGTSRQLPRAARGSAVMQAPVNHSQEAHEMQSTLLNLGSSGLCSSQHHPEPPLLRCLLALMAWCGALSILRQLHASIQNVCCAQHGDKKSTACPAAQMCL